MATGKLMKYIGDGAEGGGLLAAPITGGASTTLILAGKLFSIGGSALEYIGKYQKNGISNELIIDASIDGGINLAPIPLIRSIKKSSYDDLTKEILENEVEKITLSTDFGIDYIEAQDKKENSQEQIDCFQDDCE